MIVVEVVSRIVLLMFHCESLCHSIKYRYKLVATQELHSKRGFSVTARLLARGQKNEKASRARMHSKSQKCRTKDPTMTV